MQPAMSPPSAMLTNPWKRKMAVKRYFQSGLKIRIKKTALTTGLLSVDACKKDGNGWMYKRLNGDQTHQGRHMRISSGEWEIQRIRLYDYK
jgi:hypothetical protein